MHMFPCLLHCTECHAWRAGINDDEDDNVELSDEELIRRFEESVGSPTGGMTQRLQKLDHEGMEASPEAIDFKGAEKAPLGAIPCLDPLTQDGQNHLWRLQHQKSFDRCVSVSQKLGVP